jgi:hypothetical protein
MAPINEPQRSQRIKKRNKGIMEEWNIGMMGKKIKYLNPLFHHSSIPICLLRGLRVLCG